MLYMIKNPEVHRLNSIWQYGAERPEFPALRADVSTNVLIIGGGMAGILCACLLKQAGADYLLVEAKSICSGVTQNTTAKLTSQHGLIYDRLIREFGSETARGYFDANEAALEQYLRLCRDIDCDFEEKDSYVYSVGDSKKLERELAALNRLGIPAEFVKELPLPFPTAGAIRFQHQAQFDPLRFAYSIARGLSIYENTAVRELVGTTAITDSGRIAAKKIIVATHFPFINKHGSYFLKLYQHRSYVIALEGAPVPGGMYVDESQSGMSFRSYKNLLLIGGGAHRTGKQGGDFRELRAFAVRFFPDASEKCAWATQDCMTLDGMPYIGHYSGRTEDLYVAAGFNKWGMTSSMTAAMILSDMVMGRENRYAGIFSPSRTILRRQLAVNAFGAVVNLLTPTSKRCPHMGCALKWNRAEHTWDCPCHGSRFDRDGSLIDNPATGDIKK